LTQGEYVQIVFVELLNTQEEFGIRAENVGVLSAEIEELFVEDRAIDDIIKFPVASNAGLELVAHFGLE